MDVDASSDLTISWEWEPAAGVQAPELAGTFARLELRAGQDFITLVEDRVSGSSRRAIHVSLYPLAEWIAYSWWFLQVHSRSVREVRSRSTHHSVRSSADGFLWPDLHIVPEGARTRLYWDRDRVFTGHSSVRYLTQGDFLTDSVELQFKLAGFVTAVIDRLVELDIKDTPLQEEWLSIQEINAEEKAFCVAAARLGLDPYSDAVQYESQIVTAAAELPSSILNDFYDVVTPSSIVHALGWVTESLREVMTSEGELDQSVVRARDTLRRAPMPRYDAPWAIGWRQASTVRGLLGVDPSAGFDIEFYVKSVQRPISERRIHAVGRGGPATTNLVVMGNRYAKTSQRFTLARAFWNIVANDQPEFLVTASYLEAQKIERAFAAELLAPAQGISDALSPILMDVQAEDLAEIAEHYGVSSTVVEHQLHNQLLGTPR